METIYNIKQLLNNTYNKYKNNVAYQMRNRQILYGDFINDIQALGTSLISLRLRNKKIGIIAENRYEWELSYLAIMCTSNIVVPIDKTLPKDEIETIIKRVGIDTLICSNTYMYNFEEIKYTISMDLEKSNDDILSLKELIEQGEKLINQGNLDFINLNINNEEVSIIYFTSGTTSNSKAVMLSQKNICTNINNVLQIYDNELFNCNDIVLCALPLNHVLEGIFSLFLSISRGAKRIYCNNVNDITTYMNDYNVTFMANVPAVYDVIYNNINENIAKNINFLFCGGADLKSEIVKKYKEKGITLLQGYGMTENSSAISIESKGYNKLGSCGKPIQEIKLIDIDENGIGELAVKSHSVMLGYYKDEEKTNQTIKDNWLLTGDLAKIDDEGYIFICGRNKDIIVLNNGKKVAPKEIEDIINRINIVKETMAFGKDNNIYAKIVTDSDYETIWKQIETINSALPEYKKIRKIFITNTLLKRTSSGKIKREEEISSLLESSNINIENNNVEDTIKLIIAKQLDTDDINQIKNNYNLANDLMSDSLDKFVIIANIEKEFNFKIEKSSYFRLVTVQDLISEVRNSIQ